MLLAEKFKNRSKVDKSRLGIEGVGTLKRLPSQRRMDMYNSTGWDENKDRQRRWVASEAKRYFGYRHHVNVMSLPGESWAFETILQEYFPRQRFFGVECNPSTFERGIANMPGTGGIRRESFRVSGRNIEVARLNGHVDFAHAHLDQVFFGQRRGAGKDFWGERTKGFDIVFLDTNSPLGSDRTIEYAKAVLPRLQSKALFAITFVVGRDTPELASIMNVMPGETCSDKREMFLRHIVSLDASTKILSTSKFIHTSASNGSNLQLCTVAMFLKRSA